MKLALTAETVGMPRQARGSLQRAFETLRLEFQPIVSLPAGRVFAYQADVCTDEPGLAEGHALRAAAERSSRDQALGRRVRALAAEAVALAPTTALFVSLGARDLLDEQLYDAAAPLGKVARRVILQLEERPAIEDAGRLDARIARLRLMGFRLATTDFGAGDGGLSSAPLIWPDFVRPGAHWVRGVHRSLAVQLLLRDLCGIFGHTRMQVIADGVQTAEDRDTLAGLGCQLGQGPLFGGRRRWNEAPGALLPSLCERLS